MAATLPPAPLLKARPRPLARFLRRGLQVCGVGLAVAISLTIVARQPFGTTLVYSLCISMCCWVLIDGGRIAAARWRQRHLPPDAPERNLWPGWGWMSACLLVGTPLGYGIGNALANHLTGRYDPGLFDPNPGGVLRVLVISFIPGAIACFFFYARERLAVVQRHAAENQLKLLQSQLEPHMLFNTLANLRVLIALDPPRAQAMLDRLIAFLRATLDASRSGSHPLEAEFARVADYLGLMQVRMGPRLAIRLELPPALAALPVPPLLLQPLVENAVKHGLEPKVAGGRVEVRAERDGDRLRLVVRDTGVGLGHATAAGEGSRFGLQQVRERLAALHGAAASFELRAADDAEGGTVAALVLPIGPGA